MPQRTLFDLLCSQPTSSNLKTKSLSIFLNETTWQLFDLLRCLGKRHLNCFFKLLAMRKKISKQRGRWLSFRPSVMASTVWTLDWIMYRKIFLYVMSFKSKISDQAGFSLNVALFQSEIEISSPSLKMQAVLENCA